MIYGITLLIIFVVVKGGEPLCSKFHYESQTLEKMIRQELAVEKMKTEIEETKKQVSAALTELSAERETFKREMDSIKTQQEKEKQQMVNDIKDQMLTPTVAFPATTVKNRRPTNGETFVFTITVINRGNGYDNKTDMFTALHKGLYSFNLHLCLADTNAYVDYQITSSVKSFLNGRLLNPTGCCYTCFSVQALASLEREEVVFVKMVTTSISGKDVVWESDRDVTNQFAGVLLQTDN